MSDILTISKVNDVFLRVGCESGIAEEIKEYFTFTVNGFRFMPAYKAGRWDGKCRLYNPWSQNLYAGLHEYVVAFAKDRNYDVQYSTPEDFDVNENPIVNEVGIQKFIDEDLAPYDKHGNRIHPRAYQVTAVAHAINKKRCLLLSPTASGKSLMLFALVRYYLDKIPQNRKILLIVPNLSLIAQMFNDFGEYSSKDEKWSVDDHCHCIYEGQSKDHVSKRVYIATWQSLMRLKKDYYTKFEVVINDEAHTCRADSLKGILEKLENCPYRIGTTGTLDGMKVNKTVIEGLLGPVFKVTSSSELIKDKMLAQFNINAIVLKHPDEICKSFTKKSYDEEIDYICACHKRNLFIRNLTLSLKGNTLVLFNFLQKQGDILYELVSKGAHEGRKVFYIHGSTEMETREQVRAIVETEKDAIILATTKIFSTGVNIKNLSNIIFASPSKSRIQVLQSIGRVLRRSEQKESATLYDIVDDIHHKKHQNYTLQHFLERIRIYNEERFPFKIFNVKL